MPVATAAQMADADRVASQELGIPLETLMENASRQIAIATRSVLGGDLDGRLVTAVAGTGNNGGDALGALRYLREWGADVDAYVEAPAERLRPLARSRYDALARLGAPLYDSTSLTDDVLVGRLRRRHAVLDGVLGYSTRGAPRGEAARLIRVMNEAHGPVVIAVDLPSGLDPDTADGANAVRADLTVTLGLPKPALLRAPDRVGELLLADIGIPAEAYRGFDARSVFARGGLLRVTT